MNIKKIWTQFQKIPLGEKLFSKAISKLVPYTSTVEPEVVQISEGYALVKMKDRRKVRNHLKSIHAAALMNFSEISSGLALHYTMSIDQRAILVEFNIQYLKKARGALTSECRFEPFGEKEITTVIDSVVRDQKGEVVAVSKATWKVGLKS